MKIVLLCSGQYNQVALANKVAQNFELAGIVIEKPVHKRKKTLSSIINKILSRIFFIRLHKAWTDMLQYYQKKYPAFPIADSIITAKINSPETINFIIKHKPDIVIVSGTSLIRKELLALPLPKGIINLHTGLSPYIKGGPNCTNWCIAKNKFFLIGNTIMWLDAGIDSGDIITTETTPLLGTETLLQLHIKVMEHAHSLYIKALKKIENDFENCPHVKQSSITEGVTFYNKQWNWNAKWAALKNLKKIKPYFLSSAYQQDKAGVKTIML